MITTPGLGKYHLSEASEPSRTRISKNPISRIDFYTDGFLRTDRELQPEFLVDLRMIDQRSRHPGFPTAEHLTVCLFHGGRLSQPFP